MLLEREMLVYTVYPTRVFQVCARRFYRVPRETGHCSVSKQLGCCSVRVKDATCGPQAWLADWKTALGGNTERTLTAAAGPSPRDPYRHALAMWPPPKARPFSFLN